MINTQTLKTNCYGLYGGTSLIKRASVMHLCGRLLFLALVLTVLGNAVLLARRVLFVCLSLSANGQS